jgi:tetratricopeptide (TPR) repeat protein
MAYFAVKGLKTKSVPAFGVLFFLLSLSIVSNIVFPIGTNMSERFMFMPSVGFCLAVCYFLYEKTNISVNLGIIAITCGLFAFKTIDRNAVWKDNFTLFTTDIKTSTGSAKLQNSVGGEYTTKGAMEKDEKKRMEYLQAAIPYLKEAVRIHPKYRNAYLLMGNAFNYMKDYPNAILAYQNCLKIDPVYVDAKKNLAMTYREAGKTAGEQQNLQKAVQNLEEAYKLNPKDFETVRLLGVANAFGGNQQKALEWFEKSVEIEPRNAHSWWDLGTAYFQVKNIAKSEECRKKARELDPNIEQNLVPNK